LMIVKVEQGIPEYLERASGAMLVTQGPERGKTLLAERDRLGIPSKLCVVGATAGLRASPPPKMALPPSRDRHRARSRSASGCTPATGSFERATTTDRRSTSAPDFVDSATVARRCSLRQPRHSSRMALPSVPRCWTSTSTACAI
jgi:hypothetical protein